MIELEKLLAAGGTPDDIRARIEKPADVPSLTDASDAADVTTEKEKEKEESAAVAAEQAEGDDSDVPVSVPNPVLIEALAPEVAAA